MPGLPWGEQMHGSNPRWLDKSRRFVALPGESFLLSPWVNERKMHRNVGLMRFDRDEEGAHPYVFQMVWQERKWSLPSLWGVNAASVLWRVAFIF